MKSGATTALIAATIAIVGALLYATRLDYIPPYLIHDEAQGALQAHAIATTGRDLSGRLLPLYLTEPEFAAGRDPLMIYVTAIGLKVLPFTEAGARMPTALVAVLDVVLMFFAARAVFASTPAGVIAALLMMLSPVHFIRGRLLLSPLYSIPFVLAWLWSLAAFAKRPAPRRFVQSCVWLVLGMYSYLAAVVMMPLYLLMTLAVAARPLRWRAVVVAAVTALVGLLPMAAWYVTHPERTTQIVTAYRLNATGADSLISGVSAAVARYTHLYWGFFDPSYLFLTGDASLINSTRTAGLFPLAFAVLLPVGFIALVRSGEPVKWVIAAGWLAAPAVSVISGAVEMNRVMFAIPFAVLVSTFGALAIWQRRSIAARGVAAIAVAAIVIQFGAFHRYYMSDSYRVSSASWLSGGVRDAVRELIARTGDAPVYISQDIEWVHRFWRFYAIEAGRLDVVSRAVYVREIRESTPANAKALCAAESTMCAQLLAAPAWRTIATLTSLDGGRRYIIFERTPGHNQAN